MVSRLVLPAVAFLSFSVSLALGQAPDPHLSSGLVVGGGTYQGGVHDDINLSTGKLNVTIPLLHLPGRDGHDVDLSLTSNTGDWKLLPVATASGAIQYDYVPDGDADPVFITQPTYLGSGIYIPDSSNQGTPSSNGFICSNQVGIQLATGATYAFPGVVYNCTWNGTTDPVQAREIGRGRESPIAMDSAGAGIVFDGTDPSNIKYKFPNGRVIAFINTGNYADNTTTDTDANGNVITYRYDESIVDTVGRVITINTTQADFGGFILSYKDPNGLQQQIALAFGHSTTNCGPEYFSPPILESSYGNYAGYTYPTNACGYTRTLTLPNGLLYQFLFNFYGELAKIQYPTGGYTRYEYDGSQLHEDDTNDREIRHKYVCSAPSGQPGQASIADGNTCSSSEQETDYNPFIPSGNFQSGVASYSYSNTINTVVTPDGTTTKYTFGTSVPSEYVDPNTGITEGYSPSSSPELSHVIMDATGKVQKTIAYSPSALLPTSVTTTLDDGSVSQTQTDYFNTAVNYTGTATGVGSTVGTFPQLKETREYDYGIGSKGALLRRTDYTWSQQYDNTSTYMPTLEASKQSYDGTGVLTSSEQRFYDQQPPVVASAVSHVVGLSMGNLTTDKFYDNVNNMWLTTTKTYDDSGNVVASYDALQHPTTYSYADSFTESSCAPSAPSAPSGAGAQPSNTYTTSITTSGLTSSYAYNSCGGEITRSVDANGNTTTLTYDLMARPLVTTRPDTINSSQGSLHGTTTYCYSDSQGVCNSAAFPLVSTVSTAIDALQSLLVTDTLDGLGRTIETETANNANSKLSIYTETTYDNMGRKQAVSNPHWTASSPTDGVTSYAYDSLNRLSYQCQPDNMSKIPTICVPGQSYIAWNHTGATTTQTDENGHMRQRVTDALGRVLQVREPDATNTPSIVTDYKYNANNQITRVDQWGSGEGGGGAQCYSSAGTALTDAQCDRVRQFTWDSLSRMVQRVEPESGTTTFKYLTASGSVCSGDPSLPCSHNDARGVVATYAYDNVNRLISVVYGPDPTNTPNKTFTYDTANPLWSLSAPYAQTNLKGRLASSSTSDGKSAELYGYDPDGRLLVKSVCTPDTCGSDHYDMRFTYDLAGDLTFQDGGVLASQNAALGSSGYNYGAVTMQYDSMTHLLEMDPDPLFTYVQHPATILSSLLYDPLGDVAGVQLGENTSQSAVYTNRGGPASRTSSDAGTAGLLTDQWVYDHHGNILSISDSSAGTASYTYDQVDRLKGATAGSTTIGYLFDSWGNLDGRSASSGIAAQGQLQASTLNQLTGYSYDAAGNMLSDGVHHYSYDADNQITSVDGAVAYTYNAAGSRIATGGSGQGASTFEYLYDESGRMVTTVGSDKRLVRRELTADNIHWGDYAGPSTTGNDLTEFRLNDQVGTLYLNVDLNGNPVDDCLAASFGESLNCSPQTDYTETHFADQKRDQESGLDYMELRYYSSSLGRFTSPDTGVDQNPGDPQSWNLYSYVRNNPMIASDPTGSFQNNVTQKCFHDRFDQSCDYENSTSITVHADLPPDPTLFRRDYVSLIPEVNKGTPAMRLSPPKRPFFVHRFIPSRANVQRCSYKGQSFYAPLGFSIHTISASGQGGGVNPFAGLNAVGHYGQFDFQRSGSAAEGTTFFSGYTAASNIAVGAYLQGAGFSEGMASAVSNTFADVMSSNAGDPNQAVYRNMGYSMAATGEEPSCAQATF